MAALGALTADYSDLRILKLSSPQFSGLAVIYRQDRSTIGAIRPTGLLEYVPTLISGIGKITSNIGAFGQKSHGLWLARTSPCYLFVYGQCFRGSIFLVLLVRRRSLRGLALVVGRQSHAPYVNFLEIPRPVKRVLVEVLEEAPTDDRSSSCVSTYSMNEMMVQG